MPELAGFPHTASAAPRAPRDRPLPIMRMLSKDSFLIHTLRRACV